jgi:5-formyltetrahydrofolate cyclo-ligase
MKKKDIRTVYKQKRSELSESNRSSLDRLIHQRFKKISLPEIYIVHHYLPVVEQHEVSVYQLIQTLKERNPNLIQAVPLMKGEEMVSVIYHDDMKVHKNQWGISEPVEETEVNTSAINCVLVPLLAFDLNGNRVGYGKGCYDRFLADCNKEVIKIGLSYFEPVDEIADTDKFDIPLNYCITPERIYEFG